jgi:hypothetical protein
MRIGHRRRTATLSVSLLAMTLLAACSASEASPQAGSAQPGDRIGAVSGTGTTSAPRPELVAVSSGRVRQSQGTVAAGGGDAPYNYGPTVMSDGGRYRIWWCSQLGVASPPGDDILYAESQSLDSGFAGPDGTPALRSSREAAPASTPCTPVTRR